LRFGTVLPGAPLHWNVGVVTPDAETPPEHGEAVDGLVMLHVSHDAAAFAAFVERDPDRYGRHPDLYDAAADSAGLGTTRLDEEGVARIPDAVLAAECVERGGTVGVKGWYKEQGTCVLVPSPAAQA
jgi:hypothetical protein